MCLPVLHGPIMFCILLCNSSPFDFLVAVYVDFRVTPSMSRWSDSLKKLHGRSSCVKVPFHLPNGRNLHFPDVGSLCIMQPELFSNIIIAWSTIMNSFIEVMLGFRSSQ